MYPCSVIKSPIEHIAFIVDGEHWVRVPFDTTLAEANVMHRNMFPSAYLPRPKSTFVAPRFKSHMVKSEKRINVKYEVRVFENGRIECSCPGFVFRRKCKHTKGFK